MEMISRWYLKKLGDRLSKMGMTVHDAMAETGVVEKAISRLPAEMQVARQMRIKRAFDLSQKHVEIPEAAREDPFREFKTVHAVLRATQMEHDERRHLTGRWWMPFHLGRETWIPYNPKEGWWFTNPNPKAKELK